MELDTNKQYDQAVQSCKDIFHKKTLDYGTSWRCLRIISITDQIYIKAMRIRTIQDKKVNRVGEDIVGELKGIVNYGIIGLIQLEKGNSLVEDLEPETAADLYDKHAAQARSIMLDKNHDYGEAWRDMRMSCARKR